MNIYFPANDNEADVVFFFQSLQSDFPIIFKYSSVKHFYKVIKSFTSLLKGHFTGSQKMH